MLRRRRKIVGPWSDDSPAGACYSGGPKTSCPALRKFFPISRTICAPCCLAILLWLGLGVIAAVSLSTSGRAFAKDGGGGGGDGGGGDDSEGDDGGHHGHGEDDDDQDARENTSISRFVDMVRSHGGVEEAEEGQGGINVRYGDGWSEAIVGSRYVLRDRRGSVVLTRPARKVDHKRLKALLP